MLGLYLVAAHLVGDFILQDRWMSARKLSDWRARTAHVFFYCLPFVPIAYVFGGWRDGNGSEFLLGLFVLHWLTDCRRFHSNLMDRAHWFFAAPKTRGELVDFGRSKVWRREPLPPNPWPPLPIILDQSLHVCQLALLGGLLLG